MVTDASSIAVVVILIAVTIGAFALFSHRGTSANHFYLPTIVYGFLGMELVAALAGEAKHPPPRHDVVHPSGRCEPHHHPDPGHRCPAAGHPPQGPRPHHRHDRHDKAIFTSTSPAIVWALGVVTLFTYFPCTCAPAKST
jgi:hypothetical protein